MKYILITGVSTGIGYDLTKAFLGKGYHVLGSVRKQEDFDRLRDEFDENFTPFLFDVKDHQAIAEALPKVKEVVGANGLAGLINNAGVALSGPVQYLPMGVYRHQFEVNLFGAIAVTQTFLPLLGAYKNRPHPPGRIINMSSVSGKIAFPFLSPYNASKFALEGWSGALRRELIMYGIKVIVIGPGAIKTPIWSKGTDLPEEFLKSDYGNAALKLKKRFQKTVEEAMPVEELSPKIIKVFEATNPKTRYTFLRKKFTHYTIPRLLPDKVLDKALGKMLGLIPGK